MKRSLLVCAAALMMLISIPKADADQMRLTLDLQNTFRNNASSGGTWTLWARKIENGAAPNGDNGIAGIRAVINNISATGITFNTGNGQMTTGGPYIDTLSNGAVEIVYGQDISAPANVVANVGVFANANQERLIASGSWPAGAARPVFGTDPDGFGSEGNFLTSGTAPFCSAPGCAEVSGSNIVTSVVTLGDVNGSNTVTNLDTQFYVAQLPGNPTPPPYNPAADINQSGTVTNLDTAGYIALLGGPTGLAAVSVVPEPSTVGLAVLAGMGLIARRRRV